MTKFKVFIGLVEGLSGQDLQSRVNEFLDKHSVTSVETKINNNFGCESDNFITYTVKYEEYQWSRSTK